MRLLITGSNGLIGSAVARALVESGFSSSGEIRCLVRPTSDLSRLAPIRDRISLVTGDLLQSSSLIPALSGVTTVIHCAAVLRCRDSRQYYTANRDGSRALAEAAAAAGSVRSFIALSSQAAAGPSTCDTPRSIDLPAAPVSDYGRSKLAGEQEILDVCRRSGIPVTVLRPAAVYGPGDRDMFAYFAAAARGYLPTFTRTFHIQFAYLGDVVRVVHWLATHPRRTPTGIYFVAEPRCYTLPELAAIFEQIVGRRVRILRIPRPIALIAATLAEWLGRWRGVPAVFNRDKLAELLNERWTCRSETIARLLDGFTYTPLHIGAAETWRWYRDHGWL